MNDTHAEPVWLDRSPGSGSLTYEEATSSSRKPANDGRSVTRTTFYDDEESSPSVDRTWEELAALNDDMYHPDREEQNRRSDQRRIVDIFCGKLDCTSHQRQQVALVFEQVDNLREFMPTMSVESFTLAAVSLAIDADVTHIDNRSTARDDFEELREECELTLSDLWTLRDKIRTETTAFDSS